MSANPLSFDAARAGGRLLQAHQAGTQLAFREVLPPDRAGAYAVQDATVAGLGAIGGWKVGAKGPQAEPTFAPLPASGLLATGARLHGAVWRMRGIEVEVGFRLGRDLPAADGIPGADEIAAAIAEVVPVIEVVETRLADWRTSDPLAQLADLQSHGALVLGAPAPLRAADIDLRSVRAYLAFDGQPVASTFGANPAADIWRMVGWLAAHAARRGKPLRAGDLVTTGSCTGMLFAPEGARVQGELAGIGRVDLQF